LFWQDNLPLCAAFFLFFAVGIGVGYSSLAAYLSADAGMGVELVFRRMFPPLLPLTILSILSEAAWCSVTLFTAMQKWSLPLWAIAIVLRGFSFGCGLFVCTAVRLPQLFFLWLLFQIIVLPQVLRFAVGAIGCRRLRSISIVQQYSESIDRALVLLLLSALQAVCLPLLLYALTVD